MGSVIWMYIELLIQGRYRCSPSNVSGCGRKKGIGNFQLAGAPQGDADQQHHNAGSSPEGEFSS